MAALIQELDTYTPKQIGENGHAEYSWSNDVRERIVQFHFQLTRTNDTSKLETELKNILTTLKYQYNYNLNDQVTREYIIMMYQMIGHTRDIIEGKGEYNLTYMMIDVWYGFFPELALFAVRCLVEVDNENKEHPYGSWKDIKYLCNNYKGYKGHPVYVYAFKLMNEQLKKDLASDGNISLAAKWIPREKSSKFGWMYEDLATQYFSSYLTTARTPEAHKKAVLKCKMDYRKLLSDLNRKLDTLQIKQCNQSWSSIDFNHVTSISMTKQKSAFMNIDKKGNVRKPDDDRVKCAVNFKNYLDDAKEGKVEVKGKRVGLNDFTKEALKIAGITNVIESQIQLKDLLNMQWKDNATQNGQLGNMIAMVDVSGSMEGDPMHAAIALGIRIAEKSKLGKRVMTFSSAPTWVNLDDCDNFVDMVDKVSKAPWGMNTNFHAALDMILHAIVSANLPPEEVQDMVMVILSDMQMDEADRTSKVVLYEKMKQKYEAAGLRSPYKKEYRPPHILFWNLRSTNGFPTLSSQPNVSMMSGFSPVLLNQFCEKGLDALQSATPWSIIQSMLSNKRYDVMRVKACEVLNMN